MCGGVAWGVISSEVFGLCGLRGCVMCVCLRFVKERP